MITRGWLSLTLLHHILLLRAQSQHSKEKESHTLFPSKAHTLECQNRGSSLRASTLGV